MTNFQVANLTKYSLTAPSGNVIFIIYLAAGIMQADCKFNEVLAMEKFI